MKSLLVSNGLDREMKPSHAIAIAVVILAGVVAVSAQNRHFGLPFLVNDWRQVRLHGHQLPHGDPGTIR